MNRVKGKLQGKIRRERNEGCKEKGGEEKMENGGGGV